jgi:lipopolysaccharide export system permease protein
VRATACCSDRRSMNGMQRYILSGLLKAILAIASVAIGVVCLLKSLSFLEFTVNQGLEFFSYLSLIALLLPSLMLLVLPIAVFVSVLFVYGKLTNDSEILAMRACGMSNAALARPALVLGIAAVVLAYAMSLYFIPVSYKQFKDIEYFVHVRLAGTVLREGQFNRLGNKLMIYMRERNKRGDLHNVLIQDDRDPDQSRTIIAKQALMARSGESYKLQLLDGNVQEYDRRSQRVSLIQFDRYLLEVDAGAALGRGPREIGIAERHIGQLLNPPSATRRDLELRGKAMAEGHQRLASPLLNLSFMAVALAALFAGDFNRRGSVMRMVLAGAIVAAIQTLHMLFVNTATLKPALLPAIHLNAILPGLVAAWLLRHSDRRLRFPAWIPFQARKEAVAAEQ